MWEPAPPEARQGEKRSSALVLQDDHDSITLESAGKPVEVGQSFNAANNHTEARRAHLPAALHVVRGTLRQSFRSLIFDASTPPAMQAQMDKEGLTRASWTVGLTHLAAMALVFGRLPEHAWILYLLQAWICIPTWYIRVLIRRRGHWFIVEPCWIINCAIALYLAAALLQLLKEEEGRLWAFRSFFALSLGFLSWSVLVSENALIWHSLTTTSAIVIHWVPAAVCFTIRWQKQLGISLEKAWPGRFPSVTSMEGTTTLELFLAGGASYGVWWVCYTIWLLSIGVGLPARGWPTIYNNFRKKNLHIFQRTGLTTERGQGALFMLVHMALCFLAFIWSSLCWRILYLHLAWTLFLLLYITWQASHYYLVEVIEKCVPDPPKPQVPQYSMEEDYD